MTITFKAEIWQYQGPASWHFVTLPEGFTQDLKGLVPPGIKGFGSITVTVRCREASWKTSIFPDNKRNAYLLPLKADFRKKLKLVAGEVVEFVLEFVV